DNSAQSAQNADRMPAQKPSIKSPKARNHGPRTSIDGSSIPPRSTFSGGTIYNNAFAGIDEESCWEFDFEGTSFDFNGQQMILRGGTSFTGHIENADTGKPEIVLGALVGVPAGSLYMSAGSSITVDGWDPRHPKQPCFVQTTLPYNNIKIPATLYGFGGTQGAVCGPGKVVTWDGQPFSNK
ncbi:hypothetical protein, partial [Komagataeibacter sp. SM21]|uniref:hypothetical protein n=1 Tax=Komagataeibacter sp. SM21 TaxID=3242899 RepID=UPI0035294CA6